MTTPAPIDLGADGPAARARPSRVVDVGAEYRGSVKLGEVIYATRYSDSTLYDRMYARAQLSEKQHKAAERLAKKYGALPRTTGRYGDMAGGDEEPDTRGEYRAALRGLPDCQAAPIDAMILAEQHPGAARLSDCQAGLDALAEKWGIGQDCRRE